jgi:hypothetical protein
VASVAIFVASTISVSPSPPTISKRSFAPESSMRAGGRLLRGGNESTFRVSTSIRLSCPRLVTMSVAGYPVRNVMQESPSICPNSFISVSCSGPDSLSAGRTVNRLSLIFAIQFPSGDKAAFRVFTPQEVPSSGAKRFRLGLTVTDGLSKEDRSGSEPSSRTSHSAAFLGWANVHATTSLEATDSPIRGRGMVPSGGRGRVAV